MTIERSPPSGTWSPAGLNGLWSTGGQLVIVWSDLWRCQCLDIGNYLLGNGIAGGKGGGMVGKGFENLS